MLRTAYRVLTVALLSGLAAACATAPPETSGGAVGGRSGYKVGIPYRIGDTWYYPHEQPDYDETGIASWYGPTFYGKQTASGEIYDGEGLTAAHRTLPLPVNVRVTDLDNGRSLVLRVNDRGPFANGRIIDVSKHAAELLGFYAQGTARVRVTYLGRADLPASEPPDETPPEVARALPRAPAGRVETASLRIRAAARPGPVQVASLDPPPLPAAAAETAREEETFSSFSAARNQPSKQGATVRAPEASLYVQVGAFSSRENAEQLKLRLAEPGLFISPSDRGGKPLYLVRSGPYDDLESANAALARLSELGNNDARIVVDQ